MTVLPSVNAFAGTGSIVTINGEQILVKQTSKENIVTQIKDGKVYEFVYLKQKDIVTATIKELNTDKVIEKKVIDIGQTKEKAKSMETIQNPIDKSALSSEITPYSTIRSVTTKSGYSYDIDSNGISYYKDGNINLPYTSIGVYTNSTPSSLRSAYESDVSAIRSLESKISTAYGFQTLSVIIEAIIVVMAGPFGGALSAYLLSLGFASGAIYFASDLEAAMAKADGDFHSLYAYRITG